MYGLSLTVRFTSPTGEEMENPAQAAQAASPMLSIMIKDGVPIPGDWRPKPAHSIVFNAARHSVPEAAARHVNVPCRYRSCWIARLHNRLAFSFHVFASSSIAASMRSSGR
jgi:hypothetical protein